MREHDQACHAKAQGQDRPATDALLPATAVGMSAREQAEACPDRSQPSQPGHESEGRQETADHIRLLIQACVADATITTPKDESFLVVFFNKELPCFRRSLLKPSPSLNSHSNWP
jgi:hypothetical protein